MHVYTARAGLFVVLAAVAWLLFGGALLPPEGRMTGIWEAQSDPATASSDEERAEALYRLGMHRERAGDLEGALEAYHRLLTEVPYVEIDHGFRHDEARLRYREILARAAREEIKMEKSWPPH